MSDLNEAASLAWQMKRLVENSDPTLAIGVVSGFLAAMIDEVSSDKEDALQLLGKIRDMMAYNIESGSGMPGGGWMN